MTLIPAQITFDQYGRLLSTAYDDIYFQPEDSRAESDYVFLQQGDVRQRFSAESGRDDVIIAELGFGTGLNFLLTWQAFKEISLPSKNLHFISFEKHPLRLEDLKKIHEYWPDLKPLSDKLINSYPFLGNGIHHCHFIDERVSLTLVFGDVTDTLPLIDFGAGVDVWYLDGFAPAKNPDMWAAPLWSALASATKSGGRITTFTAAGAVRRGLQEAGFTVEKSKGYGRKRDMLIGVLNNTPEAPNPQPGYYQLPPSPIKPQSITIIGAGISGCALAEALTRYGHAVTVLDRQPEPASEASGNPFGAVYPKLNATDTPADQFYQQAFSYSRTLYKHLPDSSFTPCGVMHIDRDDETRQRHLKISGRGLPADLVSHLEPEAASDCTGVPLDKGGMFFPAAGTVSPPALCQALLQRARATGLLTEHYSTPVTALNPIDGSWQIETGNTPYHSDMIILADGTDIQNTAMTGWLPIEYVRGQVTGWRGTKISQNLRTVLCHKGYMTPDFEGRHWLGATFDKGAAPDPAPKDDDHQRNMSQLFTELPVFDSEYIMSALSGRMATRVTTPDRLPLTGPLIDKTDFDVKYAALLDDASSRFTVGPQYWAGLYVCGALGSHGMTTAPYLAEILAAHLSARPLPIDQKLFTALLPTRFAVRGLKRKKNA